MPMSCIAIASRSVSFSILPSAAMVSCHTVSASLRVPSVLVTLMPSLPKASAIDPDPSCADSMFFLSFVCDFAMAVTETSTCSDTSAYFCRSFVLTPVTCDSVFSSSAAEAALYVMVLRTPTTAAPASETPRMACPAAVSLLPISLNCSAVALRFTLPTFLS